MSDTIPVIDLGDSQDLPRRLVGAYAEVGFAYVAGHGVHKHLIDGIFEAARRFHALPMDQKMAVALDGNHRGYIPIDSSTDRTSKLANITKPNQSESFMIMREAAPSDPEEQGRAFLAGPNQWPMLDGFRAAVEAYQSAMVALAQRVMAAFAVGLGVDAGTIARLFRPPTLWLRLLHYPPQSVASPGDLYGSAPHTDWGAITILAQDDVGGLQVMDADGSWIDAPPVPGTFVLNVGDMLHRLSNGILKSTPHRVINRSGRQRYSCPFFYDPSVLAAIQPLPETVSTDRPPAYESMIYGDFLRHQLGATYDRHTAGADG